jgi:hypothetical protein
MKLTIIGLNNAVDESGNRTEGYDVVDDAGQVGWLRPSLRLRLESGCLDLKPGDTVLARDFVCGGNWPTPVAHEISKTGNVQGA